jgi:hypothetical protein
LATAATTNPWQLLNAMQACATKPVRNDAITDECKNRHITRIFAGAIHILQPTLYIKTAVTRVRRLRVLDRRSVRYFRRTGDVLKEEEMRA